MKQELKDERDFERFQTTERHESLQKAISQADASLSVDSYHDYKPLKKKPQEICKGKCKIYTCIAIRKLKPAQSHH